MQRQIGTVYGVALNYRGILEELGQQMDQPPYKAPPRAPVLYIKTANTFRSAGEGVPLTADLAEVSIGAALGVVISKTATRVSEHEALDYVQGFVVVNDISVPHDSFYRPAVRHKCRDGFCSIGSLTPRSALNNPDALAVRVYVNDALMQENTTANLVRPIARLIADVTEFMTLSAGDVLLTGTPEKPPRVRVGDRVRIEIDQLGKLENVIVAEGGAA